MRPWSNNYNRRLPSVQFPADAKLFLGFFSVEEFQIDRLDNVAGSWSSGAMDSASDFGSGGCGP
jgi:hypothetical protein